MLPTKISSALISVFDKDGLDPLITLLHDLHVTLYSTGGTKKFIESMGIPVIGVETLTNYPEILDGRVKTLHPKVFGGLLARREEGHLSELATHDIPSIDCLIVDLYPFEQTVATTQDEAAIIEKIDIGGVSLIRAAAKNYKDVVVVASKERYHLLTAILQNKQGFTTLDDRRQLARWAFQVTSHYDTAIFQYFDSENYGEPYFKQSYQQSQLLRYGENPHQKGIFFGNLDQLFEKKGGKEISYNNLVDIDAAMGLLYEFKDDAPTFAILKHTNACGVATRPTTFEAWQAALSSDPVSAFGGILICNATLDIATAQHINELFYEVLIANDFEPDALALLTSKKQRIILKMKDFYRSAKTFRSLLNGVIQQDTDVVQVKAADLDIVTEKSPTPTQMDDLLFANKCVKHLKSNAIALAKNGQLLGMGCGQTSRVDALRHAIAKAQHHGFDLHGAVMASDAFFPFPDCVAIAYGVGISAVIQPGGSVKDQESVAFCNSHGLPMVMTGIRHFRH